MLGINTGPVMTSASTAGELQDVQNRALIF